MSAPSPSLSNFGFAFSQLFSFFLPCFVYCVEIPGSLPCLLRLLPLLFWALVPVCSCISLRSGICPCCAPDALLSLPCCPDAGRPATASTGTMGSPCSGAWTCSRAWTCSSWAAMEKKGVLGPSVPGLARARPLCGQSLGCHWERALGEERLLEILVSDSLKVSPAGNVLCATIGYGYKN